jgi:thiamine biosynthesis lipoprotein
MNHKQFQYGNPRGQKSAVREDGLLLPFLLKLLGGQSKTSVKALLKHGQILLNGKPATHFNTPLKAGDEIFVSREKAPAGLNHPQLKIVWEDDDIIVVDKREGLLSVSDSPAQERTAWFLLNEYVKKIDGRNKIFILHRLDRGTSGLMMFAKNRQAQETLRNNWQEAITQRQYIAVVEGIPEKKEDTLVAYLAENSRYKVYCTDPQHGKEALLHYSVLKSNSQYSLVELNLKTGRKNQIRAQMEHIGHPVAGDPKYGARTNPCGRLMLHARSLCFMHPATGKEMRFESPLPGQIRHFFLLLFCFLTLLSCAAPYCEESGTVFHTLYHITYQHDKLLTDKIDKELQDFNLSLNPFNPNSIIAKVNSNREVEVDERFETVFNKAREVYEASGGAFDPTVAPLINLWGFGFEKTADVSQQTIDSLKQFVGYDKIRIENRRVIKEDPRIQLNFSAIAKGYASDVIAALLEREGVDNYMVEIGGEVAAGGKNPYGDCWKTGISKPETGMTDEYEVIIQLCNKCGLATSGDYRNFYVKDGKKYAHTIDPKSGYPAEQDIISATVIAPDCMTADAYATAFMTLGVDRALRMADKIRDIKYYIIYADGESGTVKTKYSDALKTHIVK